MEVYLASPFFNKKEREFKARVKEHLEEMGIIVIDPQPKDGASTDSWNKPNHKWGYDTFMDDVHKIDNCDMVIAIDWGLYSDSGTAFEVGYAYSKNLLPLIIMPKESLSKPHSLMVCNGSYSYITEQQFFAINDEYEFGSLELYKAFGVLQK